MNLTHWDERLVTFSDADVQRYYDAGLWEAATLATQFHAAATRHTDNVAVIARDGSLTYRELDERSDRLALGLIEAGLQPRDRILFQVTNRLDSVTAWYGALKAGLIPVATLAAHRMHEISEIARRTGAVAHLVDTGLKFDLVAFAQQHAREYGGVTTLLSLGESGVEGVSSVDALVAGRDLAAARAAVERIQAGIAPEEPAVFQLSGGTTGVPKVIPRTHADYWHNAVAYAQAYEFDAATRVGHGGPIIHNAGIVCAVHAPHSVGGTTVLPGPDLREAVPFLVDAGLTHLLIGRANMALPLEEVFAPVLAGLRGIVFSGGPVPPETFEAVEAAGVPSGQLFGMGEGLFTVSRFSDPAEVRARTLGRPISPLDELVVMEPGTEDVVPDGTPGELVCTGPYTLRGYYDADEKNQESFTSTGLYRTGDLAVLETVAGQRVLRLAGRLKDLVNRGGEKINAVEVETLLLKHEGILEAALVAMPDERLGERACAFLVAAGEPLTLQDIQAHLDGLGVAKYKWPERLEWRSSVPRTPVGKLDKRVMHAEIAELVDAERREGSPGPRV